eukprot:15347318-Alexandrium_andersonii.AAC.1
MGPAHGPSCGPADDHVSHQHEVVLRRVGKTPPDVLEGDNRPGGPRVRRHRAELARRWPRPGDGHRVMARAGLHPLQKVLHCALRPVGVG